MGHLLSASADGATQADTFLSFLEKNGGLKGADMPPVVDLEWDITQSDRKDRWQSHSPEEIIDITLAWLKRVERKNRPGPRRLHGKDLVAGAKHSGGEFR